MKTKRLVDIGMTCLLLFLMAYQVTEQAAHEWLGMGMTALVILHGESTEQSAFCKPA